LSKHKIWRNFETNFVSTSISMADLKLCTDAAGCGIVPILNQHGDSVRTEFKKQETD